VPVGVGLGVGIDAIVDQEHLVPSHQVASVHHDLLQPKRGGKTADRGLVAVQERAAVLGDQAAGEEVAERPAPAPCAMGIAFVHGGGDRVAGALGPQHVRAPEAGETGAHDRNPGMGLQPRDAECARRRRTPGQRRAGGQPAGADQQFAPGAPLGLAGAVSGLAGAVSGLARAASGLAGAGSGLAGASQDLVDWHASARGLPVRREQAARPEHPGRTRRPGAASTHPRHGAVG
jgi:hypothetical protein